MSDSINRNSAQPNLPESQSLGSEPLRSGLSSGSAGPALSVVVIGRNEGERLARCLDSVHAMHTPAGNEVQLIYVDSASTDGSAELAGAMGAAVVRVQPERPSAALGRNAGWRRASADLVLFLDGDTVLHPGFVSAALPYFDDPRVAVVWGHRRELRPQATIFSRALDLDWVYPVGPADFCGGDALIRRAALAEAGGYDDGLIAGEEPEMGRRLRGRGYTILHIDAAMTGHDLAMTRWSQYWRRAFRAGYAYAEVSARFRGSGLPLWEREARRNGAHCAILAGLAAGGAAGSLALHSAAPGLAALALLLLLVARTAIKARWKSSSVLTLALYGVHSHLQQVPIFCGQLQRRLDERLGQQRQLIEYKEVQSSEFRVPGSE